jgi:hypothetical protein
MKIVAVVVIAAALVGCKVHGGTTPASRPSSNLPFDPETIRADPSGVFPAKGPYHVELAVRATRSITAADQIALRVVASGAEVVSVPVVVDVPPEWNGAQASKVFTATVAIPAGDYDVELVYQQRPILGHAFKIAEVPVWGGGRQVQFFWHQRTRVDLDHNWLRLARWVVEDEPTQAYVIEWWQRGKRVLVTKARTDRWKAYQVLPVVQVAVPRKDAETRPTIWKFAKERYDIPKDLVLIGGAWEARVYREGAPPVAIAFELGAGSETQESRVALKPTHLSAELFLRPLSEGLGPQVFAMIPGKQQPSVEPRTTLTLVEPIAFDRAAVRALFRSPELARKWLDFLKANGTTAKYVNGVKLSNEQDWNLTAYEKQQLAQQPAARDPEEMDATKKARATRLRPQILALLKKHSGPWQPGELPK